MVKQKPPTQDRGRIAKLTSGEKWPSLAALAAAQTRECRSPRLSYLHVSDTRMGPDGRVQFKIVCHEWIDKDVFNQLQKWFKENLNQQNQKATSYSERPLTKEDEELGSRAISDAVARYPPKKAYCTSSENNSTDLNKPHDTQGPINNQGRFAAPKRYPKRTNSGFADPHHAIYEEENESSEDGSIFEISTEEEFDSGGEHEC